MTNIAELLKDAPKGMKLYSPLFGEVEYCYIGGTNRRIWVCTKASMRMFSMDGRYCFAHDGNTIASAECLLFPSKDCRTWEWWKLPVQSNFKVGDWVVFNNNHNSVYRISKIKDTFYILIHIYDGSMPLSFSQEELLRPWTIEDAKDGDVLATDNGWTCIFQAFDGCGFSSYCFMDSQRWFCESGSEVHTPDSRINGKIHPATKEQRDLLFDKMKEAGYQWDAGKKELRKIKPHYDIANFHAGMPVLLRDGDGEEWNYLLFSHYRKKFADHFFAGGNPWYQCIPFEGNEHLLGTTDMCDEQYINW